MPAKEGQPSRYAAVFEVKEDEDDFTALAFIVGMVFMQGKNPGGGKRPCYIRMFVPRRGYRFVYIHKVSTKSAMTRKLEKRLKLKGPVRVGDVQVKGPLKDKAASGLTEGHHEENGTEISSDRLMAAIRKHLPTADIERLPKCQQFDYEECTYYECGIPCIRVAQTFSMEARAIRKRKSRKSCKPVVEIEEPSHTATSFGEEGPPPPPLLASAESDQNSTLHLEPHGAVEDEHDSLNILNFDCSACSAPDKALFDACCCDQGRCSPALWGLPDTLPQGAEALDMLTSILPEQYECFDYGDDYQHDARGGLEFFLPPGGVAVDALLDPPTSNHRILSRALTPEAGCA